MNPDGTPIQAAPAAPAAPAVPAAAPVAPVAPAPAPSIIDPFATRGVEGAPHPGEMVIPGVPATISAPETPAPATPTAPTTPATPPAAVPAPAASPEGLRGQLASLGLSGVERFTDDASALQALVAQAQAASVLQQQLQAVHQQQQAAQLAAQQAALAAQARQVAPAAAPAPADPLRAPEYSQVWENLVVRDDKGTVTGVVPGVPQDILQKYHAYHAWRKDFADRLLTNPRDTLAPLVAQQAAEQARQLMAQEFAQRDQQQFMQTFIAQHSEWLYSHDAAGQPVRNPATGQPILSPLGSRFKTHLETAHQMGISDIRQQERYARTMLSSEWQQQQFAQQQAAAAATAPVVAANRRPNETGTLPANGLPSALPQNAGLSLREQMAADFAAAGITDAMLAASMG